MDNEFIINDFSQAEDGHSLAQGKSVDVFNALSLYNEELGTRYEQEGYNPFGEDFVLTPEFANDILENKSKDPNEIMSEYFLEFGNKQVSKHFENALSNGQKLVSAMQEQLNNAPDEKVKKQIKKNIIFLKNRNELLKVNIAKLKQKDANAIKMYLEMYGMDSELSELLKDTFNEKANTQMIVSQMMNIAFKRSTNIKQKAQVLKKVQEAQANNQAQAQTENLANQTAIKEQQQAQEQQQAKEQEQIQQQNLQEQQKQIDQNQNIHYTEQDMSR